MRIIVGLVCANVAGLLLALSAATMLADQGITFGAAALWLVGAALNICAALVFVQPRLPTFTGIYFKLIDRQP